MQNTNYTGSLKTTDDGQSYTWSVKAFSEWKIKFYEEYFQKTGRFFKSDFPTKLQREQVYKKLLGFTNIDIFQTGRDGFGIEISQERFEVAKKISDILLGN